MCTRRPPFTTVVGFELLDLFGVVLAPLLATSDDLFAIKLVVFALVSGHSSDVGLCPCFLVLGDLLFMLFLVLSTSFDPVRQVSPRPFILGVLLLAALTILANAALDTRLALAHPTIQVAGCGIKGVEKDLDATALANLGVQTYKMSRTVKRLTLK